MIAIINQLFEIEQKLQARADNLADRNFKRIYHELETEGYQVINPINRPYNETDTDLEATLSGDMSGKLMVTRVLKPVIYQQQAGQTQLLQKGIVIVEGTKA